MTFHKFFVGLICLFLLSSTACFSQSVSQDSVVSAFNQYLADTHLNNLIKATKYNYQQQLRYEPAGAILAKNVQVLTLEPANGLTNPLRFAAAWKTLLQQATGKLDIYAQLFLRLSNYTTAKPQNLAIQIKTSRPEVISYLVYFDDKITVKEPTIEIKGGAELPFTFDPGDDLSFGGTVADISYTNGFEKRLKKGIEDFLTSDNDGKNNPAAKIDRDFTVDNVFRFTAYNIHGKITDEYYEVIDLRIYITPGINHTFSANYTFLMRYGTDPYASNNILNRYGDGIKNYHGQMTTFSGKVAKLIKKISNEERNAK